MEWLKSPSTFKLSATHPYSIAVSGGSVGSTSGSTESAGTSSLGSGGAASALANAFSKLQSKCEELENFSKDQNLSQLDGLIKALFASLKE